MRPTVRVRAVGYVVASMPESSGPPGSSGVKPVYLVAVKIFWPEKNTRKVVCHPFCVDYETFDDCDGYLF